MFGFHFLLLPARFIHSSLPFPLSCPSFPPTQVHFSHRSIEPGVFRCFRLTRWRAQVPTLRSFENIFLTDAAGPIAGPSWRGIGRVRWTDLAKGETQKGSTVAESRNPYRQLSSSNGRRRLDLNRRDNNRHAYAPMLYSCIGIQCDILHMRILMIFVS